MSKYYAKTNDPMSKQVLPSHQTPKDMTGWVTVDLPPSTCGYYKVDGKEKEYPAESVVRAIAFGQLSVNNVRGV